LYHNFVFIAKKNLQFQNYTYFTLKLEYKYKPEYYLNIASFYQSNEKFFEFSKNKMNSLDVKPNITHKYLKKFKWHNMFSKQKIQFIIDREI